MFCPECQAEYRPGFTRCSDCAVDLVEKLPESGSSLDNAATRPDQNLQEVWVGQSQEQCVAHCAELRVAGIPYQVIQYERRVFKDVQGNYRIGVLPEVFDSAKEIIEQGNPEFSEDSEGEFPAQDDRPPTDVDDEHLDWKDEVPDDATAEVATETARDAADLLVMALRENDIESRIAIQPDGTRKIFVTLDDATRAREIVREIETETPPE
jgi:hypothetical protein